MNEEIIAQDLLSIGVGTGIPEIGVLRHDLPRGEAGADQLHGRRKGLVGGVGGPVGFAVPAPGADLPVDGVVAVFLHRLAPVVAVKMQHRAGHGVHVPVYLFHGLEGRVVEADAVVDQLQAVAGVHVDVDLTGGHGVAPDGHGGLGGRVKLS